MTQRRPLSSVRRRPGFTLIELVVVLIIIATLAGLAIPIVGMLGRSSDMAASAGNQAELANNIQLFFVMQKRYPQGFDSLLDTTGAVYASDTANEATQTRGLPISGSDGIELGSALAKTTLTVADKTYARSLARSGFDWVYDHSLTATNANNSGTTFRGLIADANGTGNAAPTTIDVAEVTSAALLTKLVPQGVKANEKIVAFGIGPKNTALTKTLVSSPVYPGADGRYYGRFIAYFKLYASGERATLIGVTDSYGRTPDYTQQQFNESLPDGGRQG